MGEIPFPSKNIQQMLLDISALSTVLGFLSKLEYGEPLAVTVEGVTSNVIYNPDDSGPYDNLYNILAESNIKKMQNLSTYIHDLAYDKGERAVPEKK